MPDGLDFMYAPVIAGMCREESLYEPGRMTLARIATMNDALTCRNENEHRAHAAAKGAK